MDGINRIDFSTTEASRTDPPDKSQATGDPKPLKHSQLHTWQMTSPATATGGIVLLGAPVQNMETGRYCFNDARLKASFPLNSYHSLPSKVQRPYVLSICHDVDASGNATGNIAKGNGICGCQDGMFHAIELGKLTFNNYRQ